MKQEQKPANKTADKHTPGKRYLTNTGHGVVMHGVAKVRGEGVDTWIATIKNRADAELFAQAPDLLAERDRLKEINKELLGACKEAKGLLEGLAAAHKYPQGNVYDDIQAAIAKAEKEEK